MRARFVGLFWRVFLGNAAILVLATLTLALTPATVSYPVEVREVAVLVIGLLLMSVANLWFLRSALGPLARLQAAVESLETPARDRAVPVVRDDEVGRVTAAFNDMLTRLETERRRATGAALSAQERERNRVSRDLHDGVGQTLTVLLLQLAGLREAAPPGLAPKIDAAREQARQALDAVRQVSRELRPGPLRELGLGPALRGLSEEITDASGMGVTVHLPPGWTSTTFRTPSSSGSTGSSRRASPTSSGTRRRAGPTSMSGWTRTRWWSSSPTTGTVAGPSPGPVFSACPNGQGFSAGGCR